MANQGFWTSALEGTPDRLNASLLQYDVFANRPAAGQEGRRFWATDTYELYRDTGASWDLVIDSDPAVGVGGLRTLGAGATQAAPGDHGHPFVRVGSTKTQGDFDERDDTNTISTSNAMGTSYGNQLRATRTPGATGRGLSIGAAISVVEYSGVRTVTINLEVDSVEKASVGRGVVAWDGVAHPTAIALSWTEIGLSAAAHNFDLNSKSSVATFTNILSQGINVEEIRI